MNIVGNFVTFFRNKFQLETPQGKISTCLWLVLSIFWFIHFIFICINLEEQDVHSFRVWMQYERVELFPQMAICPAIFQEPDAKFTVQPTCFSQDRQTQQKSYLTAVAKTFTTPDKKFSITCPVYNTQADFVLGNNTVFCEFAIRSTKTHRLINGMAFFTQAGEPNWFGCESEVCPNGPNRANLDGEAYSWIGIEATSYADDDDAGFHSIKYDHKYLIDGDLKLPQRAYKADTRNFPYERNHRQNLTFFSVEWTSQDLWIYQPYKYFDFWGWVSYMGGAGFLMVMIHSFITTLIGIFVFGDVGETNRSDFQRL